MPYITKMQRAVIDEGLLPSDGPGGLNYAITQQIKRYIDGQPLNYQRINDVIGALEGAKLEFYRRIAAPYEDTKIQENGDVY
jgi:hypothetical protein